MATKKKTLKRISGAFFGVVCLLSLLLVWWSQTGIPGILRERILTRCRIAGVWIEASAMRIRFDGTLELDDVIIRDYDQPTVEIARASRLRCKIRVDQWLPWQAMVCVFAIHDGIITIPLPDGLAHPGDALRIDRLDLTGTYEDRVIRLTNMAFAIANVNIAVSGEIITPTLNEWRLLQQSRRQVKLLPLSIAKLQSLLPPSFVDRYAQFLAIARAQQRPTNAALQLQVHVPVVHLSESRISFRLNVDSMCYRGVTMNFVTASGTFGNGELIVDEFGVDSSNQEYVKGNVRWELPSDSIAGQFVFHGYPKTLIAVANIGERLGTVPELRGSPVTISGQLHPSKRSDPKNWNLDCAVKCDTIAVLDAAITSLTGDLRWRGGSLSISTIQARFLPDVDLVADGWVDFTAQEAVIQARILGDPRFIGSFSASDPFRSVYSNIWRGFQWNGKDRPEFNANLYFNRALPAPGLLLQFSSRMTNFSYNGVPLQEVTGDVFADLPGSLILLHNLRVQQSGRMATGDLAWHGQTKDLEFHLASEIQPSSLMGLFGRSLQPLLATIGFHADDEPPTIIGDGRVHLGHHGDYSININIAGPRVDYRNAELQDVRADVVIEPQAVAAKATIGAVTAVDWTAKQVDAHIIVEKGGVSVTGHAPRIENHQLAFGATDFRAGATDGTVDVVSQSATTTFRDWTLMNVAAKSRFVDGRTTGEATIANGAVKKIELHNIKTNFQHENGIIRANIEIENAIRENEFQLSDMKWQLRHEDGAGSLVGNVADCRYGPILGTGTDLQVNCQFTESETVTEATIESFTCWQDCTLSDVAVNSLVTSKDASGAYQVGSIQWGDGIRLADAVGTYKRQGSSWSFDNRCDQVQFPFGTFFDVLSTGSSNPDYVQTYAKADHGEILGQPLEQISAAIQYENGEFSVTRFGGDCYGGTVSASASMNPVEESARLWTTLEDIDFGRFTKSLDTSDKPAIAGVLDGNAELTISTTEGATAITGVGKIGIDNGDFWRVPLLSDFMHMIGNVHVIDKVIPARDIGNITQLTSSLEFRGDRIFMPDLQTNGGLVAIKASGSYWWENKNLDFRVVAEPLKPFFSRFVPQIIDPFSVLLERQLTGTLEHPIWKEGSAIRDLFTPNESPPK